MTIEQYIAKLKKADKAYITEQLLRIVQEESNFVIDLNQSQMLSGIDSKGNELKEYASKGYAAYKNKINSIPGFGVPDLKLTGAFQREMYLQFSSKGFPVEIFSRDEKTQTLTQKYGKDIFGVTQDNLENLRDHLKPKIAELFASIFAV